MLQITTATVAKMRTRRLNAQLGGGQQRFDMRFIKTFASEMNGHFNLFTGQRLINKHGFTVG